MLQTIVLALLQSATEFLPVSSSGHLILVPQLLHWPDQGMAMDIVLHVGTLFSVLIYFRRDVGWAAAGTVDLLKRRFKTDRALFAAKLGVACIPVFFAGFFLAGYISEHFRNPRLIASTAIIFGILLYWADKKSGRAGTLQEMSFGHAFMIGLAQMLALIPGVSRSGITITAARALGISREEAARFSMLLSVPTIAAAGLLGVVKAAADPVGQNPPFQLIALGMIIAFVGGAAAISFLMRWLKTSSFAIFAVYRVLLGAFLFYLF
ncbi:MAG: undecaprenyl-diphosphate phosphatase [Alphaproteobacteria bacterium]|nr:undecaprenyl-diphosphate phosphatase [Alphaproteobacteria bacterium]